MRAPVICGFIGIGLCVAAMFLPAVRFPPDSPPTYGPGLESLTCSGWYCTTVVLMLAGLAVLHPNIRFVPILLVGGINPLLVVYLLFSMRKRTRRFLPFIAGVTLAGCAVMWSFLANAHVTLLIGHYLWIAGIAMILFAPLAKWFGTQEEPVLRVTP